MSLIVIISCDRQEVLAKDHKGFKMNIIFYQIPYPVYTIPCLFQLLSFSGVTKRTREEPSPKSKPSINHEVNILIIISFWLSWIHPTTSQLHIESFSPQRVSWGLNLTQESKQTQTSRIISGMTKEQIWSWTYFLLEWS